MKNFYRKEIDAIEYWGVCKYNKLNLILADHRRCQLDYLSSRFFD